MKLAAVGALAVPTMVLVMAAVAIVDASGARLDLQSGRARLHRDALRVHVAVEQQRQRVRRLRRDDVLRRRSARSRSTSAASSRCSPALAIGGSLAAKKVVPASAGTFRTDGATFGVMLLGVIALTAGLMILPALTLGPIVEGLMH